MPILEKTSPSTHPEELRRVATICDRLRGARTQGELGMQIAQAVTDCSLHDLQRIGGRLKREIDRLPSPYREAVRPYLTEQLFGSHHTLLTLYRAGAFHRMGSPWQTETLPRPTGEWFRPAVSPGIVPRETRICGVRGSVFSTIWSAGF